MADEIDFSKLPAVPGMLLGNAGSADASTFTPQRGMGLTTGQDSEPPAPDTPAPAVPLMTAAAEPAPVPDARDAEILPAGPFQAPEFRRPAEVPKNQVADNFAKYRDAFKAR